MNKYRAFLNRLDAWQMDDPDNHEGHPEDRCNVCDLPVVDHPCWPHRRLAFFWSVVFPRLSKL